MTQVLVFVGSIAVMLGLMGALCVAATGDRRAFREGIRLWIKVLGGLAVLAAVFALIAMPIVVTLG